MSYPPEKSEKESARASSIIDEKVAYQGEVDGSSIVEGSEDVTEHELLTLRHVADRLPYTAWFVVIVEFAERFVITYHCKSPLLNLVGFKVVLLRHDEHLQ